MSETPASPEVLNDRRFSAMNSSEKLVFVGKAIVFFFSGGFIYPTMWVD